MRDEEGEGEGQEEGGGGEGHRGGHWSMPCAAITPQHLNGEFENHAFR